MASPYDNAPARAFWRSGVVAQDAGAIEALYVPKFAITRDSKIMTAGSCFAQHLHRSLHQLGWGVMDAERIEVAVPQDVLKVHFYGVFSARYGNIYTVRQLRQLIEEALYDGAPALPVWERDGRYFDALRPNVEPQGYSDPAHVKEARAEHLEAVRDVLRDADVIVFTLGLTESWRHRSKGTIYPVAPGVIAGQFDPAIFEFYNAPYEDILDDMRACRDMVRAINPGVNFLLSVSPVPLTATASGKHVLSASSYSKSVMRSVCGVLAREDGFDYFPSYEVITSPSARGVFFRENLREPTQAGVAAAMGMFLAAHGSDPEEAALLGVPAAAMRASDADPEGEDELICEEAMLDAMRPRGGAQ
ncbi:MAG: GSCFA domain-containing protein [Paracoccaceae bacterium]